MSKQEIELKEGMTARIDGGKVIIETKEWTPADGDFVTHKDGWIHIHKNTDDRGRMKYYVAVSPDMGINVPNHGTEFIGYEREIRGKSTTSEIQKFNTLLEKAGKKWNAELKMVEDIKPMFKDGDFVHCAWGDNYGILILKGKYNGESSIINSYFQSTSNTDSFDDFIGAFNPRTDRLATYKEKSQLLSVLMGMGKVWNATKKRIEDIKPTVVEMTMEQVCEKLGMNVKIVKK